MKDDSERNEAGVLDLDPEADAESMDPRNPEATGKGDRFDLDNPETGAPLVSAFLDKALETMDRRNRGEEKPVPVPWSNLGEALGGGLWPGMYVLVGNPGAGKSQAALQIAIAAAETGTPVLYLGLELGEVDTVARLIGLLTGRFWSKLYLGKEAVNLADPLTADAVDKLRTLPFRLRMVPPFGWQYSRLYAESKAVRDAAGKPPLVVLDYLQIVQGEGKEEIRERVGKAAYQARAVARQLGAVVLLVSSTAREHYRVLSGRANETARDKPTATKKEDQLGNGDASRLLGTGKEAGEIEFAADAVMVLCSDREKDKDWLALAKVRAGQTAWVELRFDGCRFREPVKGKRNL